MAKEPMIVAMGGGGFSMEPTNPLLDDYTLSLTGKDEPRVCFIGTASGDAPAFIVNFYTAFNRKRCRASHLSILQGLPPNLEEFVLSQDVIYVGGGNTATMMASWLVMGLDEVLRKAWREGVIMTGLSAGSLCWFEAGPSDSWTPALIAGGTSAELRPVQGLGLIRGSHCPHYDGEPQRRPMYQQMVKDGLLADGYAADDGAALVFRQNELVEVVSSRPKALGWRVERDGQDVRETSLPTRYLG